MEKTAPVFNMYGFDGATLSLLQEATGLTKGSLYGNFADKEEIAREAFGRSLRVVLRTVAPADGDLGLAASDLPRSTLARERAATRAESDPVVRSALELFRGELTEIKEEE